MARVICSVNPAFQKKPDVLPPRRAMGTLHIFPFPWHKGGALE
jgi:hypothetical protein